MNRRWYDIHPLVFQVLVRLEDLRPVERFQTVNYIHHRLLEKYPYTLDLGQDLLHQKILGYLSKRRSFAANIWTEIELWQFLPPDALVEMAEDTLAYIRALESNAIQETYTVRDFKMEYALV